MHGRHRAGGGARGACPLPARGAHGAARGARGAGAGRDPPPARQRDRAHAGARDRAGGAGAARRRRPRGDRRSDGSVSALFITGTDTRVGKTFVACALATALREGAGGLLVPLDAGTTWAELAVRAGLPLLVVGANRLGTVNHCALTARVAAAAGLVVRGFVLSQPTAETDPSAATNAETIAALTGLPCLGVLGHGPTPGDAVRALDVAALL